MEGIPILEIDCNMEFHDDEGIKKKMLEQVNYKINKLQTHSKMLSRSLVIISGYYVVDHYLPETLVVHLYVFIFVSAGF